MRSLWQREPVRVMNAAFTAIAGINAVLLAAGVYDGGMAGIITGLIAVVAAFVNEIFTRAEVVPLRPSGGPRSGRGDTWTRWTPRIPRIRRRLSRTGN